MVEVIARVLKKNLQILIILTNLSNILKYVLIVYIIDKQVFKYIIIFPLEVTNII